MSTLIDQVNEELATKIVQLKDLEEQSYTLTGLIREIEDQVRHLQVAADALSGKDFVRPAEYVPPPVHHITSVPIPPIVHRNGPTCNSCGGEMHPVERTLQSGRTVNLLACSDCSNERL